MNELYDSQFTRWSNKERLNWLMDQYGNSVIRLAFIYVRNKQSAEDIAQDVFMKCYQKIRRI